MNCLSISYKNADIDIRKKFAFPEDVQKAFSEKLIYCGNVQECVILCTCNRTEVYFCGNKNSVSDVKKFLSEYSGISESDFIRYIRFFSKKNAVSHLFRVACGIESMVIGEDEILGQLKKAYSLAYENKTVSHRLNIIFQSAVTCAKKVKTDTELSKTSVSTAT
ncbi:MAG: glutamyl-tRNA reductase, partial [Oscillospiraceae bacterium]|nr:glutamyl-tRNA reductase [Oscillospiraceae bacterium]